MNEVTDEEFKKFKASLRDLLVIYNASLGVEIEGDIYGITHTDFVVTFNGGEYYKKRDEVLNNDSAYLDASDLEES